MSVSGAISFIGRFSEARMRRMFPGAEVEVYRSREVDERARVAIMGNVMVDERELVRYEREESLRRLSRRLEPRPPSGRHWSLFRRRSQ